VPSDQSSAPSRTGRDRCGGDVVRARPGQEQDGEADEAQRDPADGEAGRPVVREPAQQDHPDGDDGHEQRGEPRRQVGGLGHRDQAVAAEQEQQPDDGPPSAAAAG
jgi:hypothetical protein